MQLNNTTLHTLNKAVCSVPWIVGTIHIDGGCIARIEDAEIANDMNTVMIQKNVIVSLALASPGKHWEHIMASRFVY
jgi:hypothetical protein